MTDTHQEPPSHDDALPVLDDPRDGRPGFVDTPERLTAMRQSLIAGSGPMAVDTERAQSYRYSAKAYLVQFRREGSGTWLLDPQAFEEPQDDGADSQPRSNVADLSGVAADLADAQWIIHAAVQDLPCLVELGLRPRTLFDTELAGRLLGLPRVGLAAMVEQYFGVRLLKEHSAADWSTRPIPTDWISYAALDVELLIELRQLLIGELEESGKQEWARQEFAHQVATAGQQTDRGERWRRLSGTHAVRTPRGMAIIRELWTERDQIAREADKAPGRVLPDAAITALAAQVTAQQHRVPGRAEFRHIPGFKRREARRYESHWVAALERVAAMSKEQLPPVRTPRSVPPAPRAWERIAPDAWTRWNGLRPATIQLAADLKLPVENLISPDHLRRIAWEPPSELSSEAIDAALAGYGARPWQRELVVPVIAPLLAAAPSPPN